MSGAAHKEVSVFALQHAFLFLYLIPDTPPLKPQPQPCHDDDL